MDTTTATVIVILFVVGCAGVLASTLLPMLFRLERQGKYLRELEILAHQENARRVAVLEADSRKFWKDHDVLMRMVLERVDKRRG